MAHDVFISHSHKDKATADAVCSALEARGVRCWIAPRDIQPGAEWAESIIAGIEGARVFLLIFSDSANQSTQVLRELERAIHHELTILPYRLQDILPSKNFEYYLSTVPWFDAISPESGGHLQALIATAVEEIEITKAGRGYRGWSAVAALVLVVAVIGVIVWSLMGPGEATDTPDTPQSLPIVGQPITSAIVTPEHGWVDIFALIDVKNDVVSNHNLDNLLFRRTPDGIVCENDRAGPRFLQFPITINGNYELELSVTRLSLEKSGFTINTPHSNKRWVALFLANREVAIGGGGDVEIEKSTRQKGIELQSNVMTNILCQVQQDGDDIEVGLSVAGKRYITWRGRGDAIPNGLGIVEFANANAGTPVLQVWPNSSYNFHSARLRMLTGEAKLLRAAKTKPTTTN